MASAAGREGNPMSHGFSKEHFQKDFPCDDLKMGLDLCDHTKRHFW